MNEAKIEILKNGNLRISVPVALRRSNKNNYIITPTALDGSDPDTPRPEDSPLARAIVDGHRYYRMIESGSAKNALEISRQTGVDRSHIGRLIRLVNLAPDIIRRVFECEFFHFSTHNPRRSLSCGDAPAYDRSF